MEHANRPITPSLSSSELAVVAPHEDSSSPSKAPTLSGTHMISEQRQDTNTATTTCVTPTKEATCFVPQGSPVGAICGSGGICDPSVLAEVLFPVFYRTGTVTSPDRSSSDEDDSPHYGTSTTALSYKGGLVTGAVLMDDPARISPDNCQKRGRFLVWPAAVGPSSVATRVLDATSASSS